jgi:hypothetical protein
MADGADDGLTDLTDPADAGPFGEPPDERTPAVSVAATATHRPATTSGDFFTSPDASS